MAFQLVTMLDTIWSNIFRGREKNNDQIVDLLRTVPLFHGLSDSELRTLEKLIHLRHYISGEAIFNEGDPSFGLYIVKTGIVHICHQMPSRRVKIHAVVTAGDFFGEAGIIDDAPRSASAIAHSPTEAIGLFKADLMNLINQKPQLGSKILFGVAKVLSARLRYTHEELSKLLLKNQMETETMLHDP